MKYERTKKDNENPQITKKILLLREYVIDFISSGYALDINPLSVLRESNLFKDIKFYSVSHGWSADWNAILKEIPHGLIVFLHEPESYADQPTPDYTCLSIYFSRKNKVDTWIEYKIIEFIKRR